MKGLSETLFDEKRKLDKKNFSSSSNYEQEAENEDPESNPTNKYNLITDSKFAECYIIDKEVYLKHMLTFTTDKSVMNKYIDELVIIICIYFEILICFLYLRKKISFSFRQLELLTKIFFII